MNKTQEAIRMASLFMTQKSMTVEERHKLLKACKEALAELALQEMVDNAKELGLDYCKENKMTKPHKWAKEIKAWADGAEIETKYGEHDWEVEYYPNWHSDQVEYRIKPQPKEPQYLYVYGNGCITRVSLEKAEDHSGVPLVGKIKIED